MSEKRKRLRVGISKASAARLAGVSTTLVTIYEADPGSVGARKRAILDRLYSGFDDLARTAAVTVA